MDQILPTPGVPVMAPGSASTANDNSPRQQLAFVSRTGGGLYLAYCTASVASQCQHIDLWPVGAPTAMVVPDSGTGHASHVALASTSTGSLRLAWYDSSLNEIRTVKTNAAVTGFGAVDSVALPPIAGAVQTLQAEASVGPLDLIALFNINVSGFPSSYWHIQLP